MHKNTGSSLVSTGTFVSMWIILKYKEEMFRACMTVEHSEQVGRPAASQPAMKGTGSIHLARIILNRRHVSQIMGQQRKSL